MKKNEKLMKVTFTVKFSLFLLIMPFFDGEFEKKGEHIFPHQDKDVVSNVGYLKK